MVVGIPVLRRLVGHAGRIALEGVAGVGVDGASVVLHLPAAWHGDAFPQADVVVHAVEVRRTFIGVGRPMEMPLSVQRHNLATFSLARRQLQRSVIGQFVDAHDVGVLPVGYCRLG